MITKEELDIKLEEGEGLIVLSKGLAIGYNLETSMFSLLTRPDSNFAFGEFGGVDVEDHVAINTYDTFNQQLQLASDIDENIDLIHIMLFNYSELQSDNLTTKESRILTANNLTPLESIKQELIDKDKLIYESQKAQMNMKSKLDKIDEIAHRKFSTSRRLEDIQQELEERVND